MFSLVGLVHLIPVVSFVHLLWLGSFYCPDLDSLISVCWLVCSLWFRSVSCSDFVCCLFSLVWPFTA